MDAPLRAALVGAATAVALGWAAPAVAQTYPPPPPPGTGVLGTQFTPTTPATTAVRPATTRRTSGGVLPRTGEDLAAAAAVGAVTVAAGATLVVVGRRRRTRY